MACLGWEDSAQADPTLREAGAQDEQDAVEHLSAAPRLDNAGTPTIRRGFLLGRVDVRRQATSARLRNPAEGSNLTSDCLLPLVSSPPGVSLIPKCSHALCRPSPRREAACGLYPCETAPSRRQAAGPGVSRP